MQEPDGGTQSGVSRITPWAEGGAETAEPPGLPLEKAFELAPELWLQKNQRILGLPTQR